jgi:hypothetical protein
MPIHCGCFAPARPARLCRGRAPPWRAVAPYEFHAGIGRGAGVGRALGVAFGRAVGVGLAVAVGVTVGVTLGVDVGVGVAVAAGVAVGVGDGVPTAAAISTRPQPTTLFGGPGVPHCL